MRKIMVLIAASIAALSSHAQSDFRQKPVTDANNAVPVSFLLPPKAKLASEGFIFPKRKLTFMPFSRFRYQSIDFIGLSGNFDNSFQVVAFGKYKRQRNPGLKWEAGDSEKAFIYAVDFDNVKNSYDLKIEFDMDHVIPKMFSNGTEKYFNDFTQELFKELAGLEVDKGWAPGIAQNILEKVFEILPLPQSVACNRFLADVTDDHGNSFILLNPKIWYYVDLIGKTNSTVEPKIRGGKPVKSPYFWRYTYWGTTIPIKFFRDSQGKIAQFPSITVNGAQNKLLDPAGNPFSLQASSADLQLTSGAHVARYVGIYQNGFKNNNEKSPGAETTVGSYTDKNCLLLFIDKIDPDFFNYIESGNPWKNSNDNIHAAVYGTRTLITPVIQIQIGTQIVAVPVDFDLGMLKQQALVPNYPHIMVERIYNGKFAKIKDAASDLKLMPADRISFN